MKRGHQVDVFMRLAAGFLAILSAGHIASATDADAERRIEQTVALLQKKPIVELEVTTHPVKPQQRFSRYFNMSLSARAYLQLMTDPSKDAQSGALLEEVGQYYLDHPDEIEDPDSAYWAGEYHAEALAKFGTNGTLRPGAIPRTSERKMLEYMLLYVNYWSRLELYEFSLKHQTYYYWNSENHWWQEIVTAWGYLLSLKDDPEFKDTVLGDGQAVQHHYDANVAYMKEHMRQRARKGFLVEISSGGYAGRMHNMYNLIYDVSPDEDLKALACKSLDLWWVFWAEEQISGERGGGKVRHRKLRGLLPNSENHMVPAWYYFGLGSKDMAYLRDLDDTSLVLAANYMQLLSDYRPADITYEILAERENAPAFSITQRRVGKSAGQDETAPKKIKNIKSDRPASENINKYKFYDYEQTDVLKYSWVSPHFILGTNMRPPYDVSSWVAGSAQGWWHGLLLAGNDPAYPERVVPTLIYPSDSMGEQYAVQSKGSMMARKLNDVWSKASDNRKHPMGIYISEGLKQHTQIKGDFIFINSPKAWVAVRAVNTDFVKSNATLVPKFQRAGNFYRLKEDTRPVIIEAAELGDYPSFEAFQDAVRNANLTYQDGVYEYESLSEDRLTLFDDRSYPRINGVRVNYTPSFAYQSPYVSAPWDSGVISVTAGEKRHTLDFTAH